MPNTIKFHKVNTLPATPELNSVYFIKHPTDPNLMEVLVVGQTQADKRHSITKAEVEAQIVAAFQSQGQIPIVADIAARDAVNKTLHQEVWVRDASADSTVASGSARYLWDAANTAWIKIAESESMDIQFVWAAIQGKPQSTPAQIDATVAANHTHANESTLNKIGEVNGLLTFDGKLPVAGFATEDW